MVLEISRSAARAWTTASPNVALRTLPRNEKRSATVLRWSTTLRTPGRPVYCVTISSPRSGSAIVTRSVAGRLWGRTSCRIDCPA